MEDYKDFFSNKKITLMGLGLLGRGINVAAFLAKCGAILTVTDLKKQEVLESSLNQLKKFKNIKYTLGRHEVGDFRNKDMIIKAAGAPLDSSYIKEARKNGIPIEMDASLFAKLSKTQIIGVTGTRGKSTTAHLIYEILKKASESPELSGRSIYLAGNIRGMATLPLLEKIKSGDLVVLELDSWQLQGFGDSKISPYIAVFTNFMPDHMNYYEGSMERYFNDKQNIFKYQTDQDYLIISPNSKEAIKKFSKVKIKSKISETSANVISKQWKPKLEGKHNFENIAYAVKVAQILGVRDEIIKDVVEGFSPIEGRLEFIREYDGVKIYNDTNSTTPDATLAGLSTLAHDKNVVLIMGGVDKGLKMEELIKSLDEYCRAVVLIPGTGTDKIKNKIKKVINSKLGFTEDLEEAVEMSINYAKKGDVILFSPGFASFGMFKNEYDRGDQFKKIIKNLKEISRVHFIGIGGIGISAIAKMMLEHGKTVTGSDLSRSEVTDQLEKLGAKIFIGKLDSQEDSMISSEVDLIIYTIAIGEDNHELKKARLLGIKTIAYPEALGLVSKSKYTVAIAGTHGKTTTTAMLAKICVDADLDPTVIVGSLLKDLRSNFISGRRDLFIVEACEYKKSFLNLNPTILVITNIDNDHLDFYKNLKEIQQAFRELAVKIPEDGFLVCNAGDPRLKLVIRGLRCKIIDYSKIKLNLKLKIPGIHNQENAKAAFAVSRLLKVKELKAGKSLEGFEGTWRRFDFKGRLRNGALIYDDYAHHPTEIKATLKSFSEKFPGQKVTVVFQPHLFSRTKLLLEEFAVSFTEVDKVVILPIYAAREKMDKTVSSKVLVEKINKKSGNAVYLPEFEDVLNYLKKNLEGNDILVTMGAGDVYKLGEVLLTEI